MRVDFFITFGKMWGNLINEHPQSHGIVGRCTVNLLSMVLDLTDFITDQS
jgi:hypothetical protein